MKKGLQKIRIIKAKEKIHQVTHWDLDYLPKDEILNLYERKTGYHQNKVEIGHETGKRHQKLSLLLITMVFFLLAGSLYVAYLI